MVNSPSLSKPEGDGKRIALSGSVTKRLRYRTFNPEFVSLNLTGPTI
jgi:hypothetical protein